MNSCPRISPVTVLFALIAWLFILFAPIQNIWAKNQAHAITLCTEQGFSTVWLSPADEHDIRDFSTLKRQSKSCSLCASAVLIVPPPTIAAALSREVLGNPAPVSEHHDLVLHRVWHANPRAPPLRF